MTIRVVVVDDQALVRSGLRMIVEDQPDMDVVGEAEEGGQALELLRRAAADVVLMDIRMPKMDGIEATSHLSGTRDAPRVVILTTFDLDEYLYRALAAGASGFMLKDALPGELVTAIRVVSEGGALLSPQATRRLIEQFARANPDSEAARRLEHLTDREVDVLRLIAQGMSNAEIAEALILAKSTIKSHVGSLLEKLGLRDRVQLAIYAYESCLARPGNLEIGQLSARRRQPLDG
jgi:DNA-binding NarL/FixJ family response regulator